MNTINPHGWHEDFDCWWDVELMAEKWEELKRLEEEYRGQDWDNEE
jgi:hypothetical protein